MQKEHNVPPNLIKNRFIVILSRTSLNCFYIPSDTFQKHKKIRKTHYNCRFLPYRKKHKRSEWFSVRWLFKRPMVAGLLTAYYTGWGAIITLTEIMVVCGFRSTSPFPPCFFGWPIHVKLVALSCLTPGNGRNYEKHCKEKAKFANYTHQEKAFTRRCIVCSTFGILNCVNSWNQIPLFILPPWSNRNQG